MVKNSYLWKEFFRDIINGVLEPAFMILSELNVSIASHLCVSSLVTCWYFKISHGGSTSLHSENWKVLQNKELFICVFVCVCLENGLLKIIHHITGHHLHLAQHSDLFFPPVSADIKLSFFLQIYPFMFVVIEEPVNEKCDYW